MKENPLLEKSLHFAARIGKYYLQTNHKERYFHRSKRE